MGTFSQPRMVIVAGKGGVGRTTVSTALALAAARRNQRVLVIECNARDRVPRLFNVAPGGYEPREMYPGIDTINITPEAALREYGVMKLRFKSLFSLVFENEVMRRLLRMIPGMNDLLILGKAAYMEAAWDRKTGRPQWDLLIIDGPPTGQGLALFRLPRAILQAVASGPLADEAHRLQALLTDPRRCCFHVVALPEEMAVNEAIELSHRIRTEIGIAGGFAFMNAVWPQVLTDDEVSLLHTFRDAQSCRQAVCHGLLQCALDARVRWQHQQHNIQRFAKRVGLPTVSVPFVFGDPFDLTAVETVSRHILAEMQRHEAHPA